MDRDTFTCWLTDTTVVNQDTLKIEFGYQAIDSTGNPYSKKDTITFLYRRPVKTRSRRGEDEEEEEVRKLIITTIRNKSSLDLNRSIPFSFNFPLLKTDTSLIHLYMTKDSVENRIPYEFMKDSFSIRKASIQNQWEDKTPYRMLILPGAFTDLYGVTNDTLKVVFTSTERESYGKLILNIADVNMPLIVQLLNTKEAILQEHFISEQGQLVMDYLIPNQYFLKFIFDKNANHKWDTGDYLKKIQPEKVAYYMQEINIRANWEFEIEWSASGSQ